jgi:hypothetical protein
VTVRGALVEDEVVESAVQLAAAFRAAAGFEAKGELSLVDPDDATSRGASIRVGDGREECVVGALAEGTETVRDVLAQATAASRARFPALAKKKDAADDAAAAECEAAPSVAAAVAKGLAPEPLVRELAALGPSPALFVAIGALPDRLEDATVDAPFAFVDRQGALPAAQLALEALARSKSEHAARRAHDVLLAALPRTKKMRLTSAKHPAKPDDQAFLVHVGFLVRTLGAASYMPAISTLVWMYRNDPADSMKAYAGVALLLASSPPVVLERTPVLRDLKPQVDALLAKTKWRAAAP